MSSSAFDCEARPRCHGCGQLAPAVVRVMHVSGDAFTLLAKLCRACIDRASETLRAAELSAAKELPPTPGGAR